MNSKGLKLSKVTSASVILPLDHSKNKGVRRSQKEVLEELAAIPPFLFHYRPLLIQNWQFYYLDKSQGIGLLATAIPQHKKGRAIQP